MHTRALIAVLGLTAGCVAASAQTLDPAWEGPSQLSSFDANTRDRAIAIDSRGRSHAFWLEEQKLEEDSYNYRLMYARFGGETWTPPVAIVSIDDTYAGDMAMLDAKIDSSGAIQLIEGPVGGPVYHRRVEVDRALNASAWSGWIDVQISTFRMKLVTDVKGGMLIFYCHPPSNEPDAINGILVTRSTDNGDTWSDPVQIDAGLPQGWFVSDLDAAYDGSNALHAAWSYVTPEGYQVREVKYARSTDGGVTWSQPYVLEGLSGVGEDFDPDFIRLAIPKIAVKGSEVHVVYAGGGQIGVGRRHTMSTDAGLTWTPAETFWSPLEGVGGADVAYFDSKGRLNVMAQVRYPQGIYHGVWENGEWAEPTLVYLIAKDYLDIMGDRVHAQYLEAAVAQDDNVVLLMETCAGGCSDTSTWPQNPINFTMHTIAPPGSVSAFATVSSATYELGRPLAAASIAAGFGSDLASRTMVAESTPLPTQLDGVEVQIVDDKGVARPAGLLFVSWGQINYVVPSGTPEGTSRIRVLRNGTLTSGGALEVSGVAPALFTANGQGTGVAAATWLFVPNEGARTSGLLFDPQTNKPLPIVFEPSKGELYLSLFGTGFRGFRDGALATVGGYFTPILSVGAQGEFEGLDQINIGPLPQELSVGAEWDILLTVDGVETNQPTVLIQDRP